MVNSLMIVWDNEAKIQLRELYQYIKQDSPKNALNIRKDIIEKIKQAVKYPDSFTPDKYKIENDGTFKAFELHRYRVSYSITDTRLMVLRIRHTSQSPLSY